MRLLNRCLLVLFDSLLWTCVLAGFLWAFGAIWFLPVPISWLTWLIRSLAVAYLILGTWLFVRYFFGDPEIRFGSRSVHGRRWSRAWIAASIVCVFGLTLLVRPTNDRTWAVDQQHLPEIQIDGQRVTIRHFRDFRYRSEDDPIPSYRDFSFQLNDLDSVWFLVQRFTRFNGMAHTFVSFGLDTPEGKKYFSISVEIRRESGELYSPIRGIYRNYELMYVVGSEQDLVGVRTNVRENDRVYLYRVNATAQQSQQLFLEFADRIESLRRAPEFYSTFRNNCTNNIVAHTWKLTSRPINPFSPRIILPGYSAEVAWELGLIGDGNQSFAEIQRDARIDRIARKAKLTESFSRQIRSQREDGIR